MIIDKLKNAGLSLEVINSATLRVTGKLTDEQRQYIRTHKAELIDELSPKCFMWSYLLDPDLLQYTRMGLMTDDIEEARCQLKEIYGKPVAMLHLIEEPEEVTTRTEDGRILITTEDGSYLWSLGGVCDFIAKGQDDFVSFPDLEHARAWVRQHIEEEK